MRQSAFGGGCDQEKRGVLMSRVAAICYRYPEQRQKQHLTRKEFRRATEQYGAWWCREAVSVETVEAAFFRALGVRASEGE